MNNFLEFREHRLPEKCAANIVDLAIDDISTHFRIGCFFEEIMRQELFVKGRSNFGQENRVIVILKALRFLRVPGVHRMAGFMRERVDVRKDIVLVIHQDKRRSPETAR